MADEDLFVSNDRLQKMIALGIYDDKTIDRMKNIKTNTNNTNTGQSSATRPPVRSDPTPIANKAVNSADILDSPFLRADHSFKPLPPPKASQSGTGGAAKEWRPPNRDHGFRPLGNRQKWGMAADPYDEAVLAKRRREDGPEGRGDDFRDGFRNGIRDGIQTKIQRNEMERKMNDDFIKDRNSGICCDTDLRPKADTDSRIRADTDFRPVSDQTINRRTAENLPLITSTANDEDFRRQLGAGDTDGRPQANQRAFNPNQRNFPQRGRGGRPAPATGVFGEGSKAKPGFDDIDDFIEKAKMKLNVKPSPQKGRGGLSARGRGSDRRPNPSQRPDNIYSRAEEMPNPFTPRPSNDMYDRRAPEERFDSSGPEVEEIAATDPAPNPSKHIAILRETVEELAKSNLFCQYCDCYLGSLVEVNTHIGTVAHQQNMAKRVMEDSASNGQTSQPIPSFGEKPKQSPQQSRPISKTIVERVPTGMSVLVEMMERRKQITLQSLTEMDSFEITTDKEASLAKELAKLLTNELLNYKMNLMPDTVKEALKHQGIGLLNTGTN